MVRICVALALAIGCDAVLAQSGGVVRDAMDTNVGLYADPGYVHSVFGFRAAFDFSTGRVVEDPNLHDAARAQYRSGLRYATTDCSGQAYVQVDEDKAIGGMVVRGHAPYELFMIEKSQTPVLLPMQSERTSGDLSSECTVDGGSVGTFRVLPANPNVEAVSGFSNSPFAPPFRVEIVPLSSLFELFRDGFEGAMLDPSAHQLV
jgi:hypothetical protein